MEETNGEINMRHFERRSGVCILHETFYDRKGKIIIFIKYESQVSREQYKKTQELI